MSLLLLLRHSASIKCCPRICTPSNCAGSSQFSARHGGDVDAAVNDVVEKLLKVPEGVERVILEITPAVLFYECGIFILSNPIPSNKIQNMSESRCGESTTCFFMSRLH